VKWSQTAPGSALFAFSDIAYHLRIDSDVQALTAEQNYVNSLVAAATEYAEEALYASLVTRTITATFFLDDGPSLTLPRGPVQSITSVTDQDGAHPGYTLERYGRYDQIICPSWRLPMPYMAIWDNYPVIQQLPRRSLAVVYQAGFGDAATNVPADIMQAIRVHVGLMYEQRQSATDRTITAVPHSLEAFYRLKSRQVPVG
jgi:uncharacterized phiE125 gp8 family phage protein